jgi:hypothetical protein
VIHPLEIGFTLDRRHHWIQGQMRSDKRPDLLALHDVMTAAGVPYAIIGGVALQVHQAEPRTTLDIVICVYDRQRVPHDAMAAAGFEPAGQHAHSDNWTGPDGTPIQITDDPPLADGIARATGLMLDNRELPILSIRDLLQAKLRAASSEARRSSKRLQDLADAQSLIEQQPLLAVHLDAEQRGMLDRLM